MATRFDLSSGGVVCRRRADGQREVALIATKGRSTDGAAEIRWGLPKGHVEEGESLAEAAQREVQEETGLVVEVEQPLEPIEYWFWWTENGEKVRHLKKVHFFLMKPIGGDVAQHDDEVEEARWFPLDEAIRRATFRTERQVLEQVAKLPCDEAR